MPVRFASQRRRLSGVLSISLALGLIVAAGCGSLALAPAFDAQAFFGYSGETSCNLNGAAAVNCQVGRAGLEISVSCGYTASLKKKAAQFDSGG